MLSKNEFLISSYDYYIIYNKLQEEEFDKIAVLGKGAVGKTSLVLRFVTNKCPKEHDPTVEDSYNVSFKSKTGEEKEFQILDTAGEEDYQNMQDNWINSSKGFILVFAINDLESFQHLKSIVTRIKKNEAENKPHVVIGNKRDLEQKREVTTQQAEEFCKTINAKYFEASALKDNNENVKVAFQECANMIMNKLSGNNDANKGCCCFIF